MVLTLGGSPPFTLHSPVQRGRPPRTRPYPRSVPVASGPLGKHPSGGAGFQASQTARSLGVYPLPSNPGWPRTRGGAAQRCAEGEPEHVTIPPQHPAMLEAPSGLSQVSQAPVMINVCRVFAKALIRVYKYAFGKILRKCRLFSARLLVLRPGWGSAIYLLVIRRVVLPPLPSVPRLLNGNYNPQPPFCYHIPCTLYNNLKSDYSTRMETPGK